jgi:hypothetical protein
MKTSIEIVSKAKLKRIQIATAVAYNYSDDLKRKLLLRRIRKEMKLACKVQ